MGDKQKLNEFEPVSYDTWRQLVERDLKGAPFDKKLVRRVAGLDIEPLYTQKDVARDNPSGFPGVPPFTRGSSALGAVEMGWDVRAEIAAPELDAAAEAVAEELAGDASSLLLRLTCEVSGGALDRVVCTSLSDLERLLEHAPLDKTPLQLSAQKDAFVFAAGVIALAKKRSVKLSALSGSFGLDPLGTLAERGALPSSLAHTFEQAVMLAKYAKQHTPGVRSMLVDSAPYHEAGANAVDEIAIALATGLAYLRALSDGGLTVSEAAAQLTFSFSIGRDFFLEIAKLRAARALWAHVVDKSGGGVDAQAMVIHARTSRRTKTQRDPWVNLLRATAESFSAAAGGADAITTGGFDELLGASDELARRLARNTQHLLRYESSLNRVVDPAGGSYYVESFTEQLAAKAWQTLQSFEKRGTLVALLSDGSLQRELKAQLDSEEQAVKARKVAITGVNEFPNVREQAVVRPAADAAQLSARVDAARAAGAQALSSLRIEAGHAVEAAIAALTQGAAFTDVEQALRSGEAATVPALVRSRLAQSFESLRDAADRHLSAKGARPRAFLANLGPISEHKARAMFAQNFVESGGFEALTNDGFATASEAAEAFEKSGASVCVLCSSDAVYESMAVDAAKALTARGAKAVVLAGKPQERERELREAGVTDFIFMGMNVYESLRSLLERAGAV